MCAHDVAVFATDINEEKLKNLKLEDSKIRIEKLDATDKISVESFCSSINHIDILFHAVGFVHHGTLMDCDDKEFFRSVNVNVYSAYLMSYNLIPKMLEKGKGNIIIISSAASNVKGAPTNFIVYSALSVHTKIFSLATKAPTIFVPSCNLCVPAELIAVGV